MNVLVRSCDDTPSANPRSGVAGTGAGRPIACRSRGEEAHARSAGGAKRLVHKHDRSHRGWSSELPRTLHGRQTGGCTRGHPRRTCSWSGGRQPGEPGFQGPLIPLVSRPRSCRRVPSVRAGSSLSSGVGWSPEPCQSTLGPSRQEGHPVLASCPQQGQTGRRGVKGAGDKKSLVPIAKRLVASPFNRAFFAVVVHEDSVAHLSGEFGEGSQLIRVNRRVESWQFLNADPDVHLDIQAFCVELRAQVCLARPHSGREDKSEASLTQEGANVLRQGLAALLDAFGPLHTEPALDDVYSLGAGAYEIVNEDDRPSRRDSPLDRLDGQISFLGYVVHEVRQDVA